MLAPTYKICLIGDGAVGKTALRDQFMGKMFSTDYKMTIGADVVDKTIVIREQKIALQIWDVAGQPFFESVRKDYFSGAVGALAIYDICNYESYGNIRNWVADQWDHNGKGPIPIVLVGNKIDLRDSLDESVIPEEGLVLANELSWAAHGEGFEVTFLEASAKTGKNAYQAFSQLAEIIMDYIESKLGETTHRRPKDTDYIRRF